VNRPLNSLIVRQLQARKDISRWHCWIRYQATVSEDIEMLTCVVVTSKVCESVIITWSYDL
jgi:hypothetical protein